MRALRALVLGRYSPAKGLETILRGAALAGGVRLEAHGSTGDGEYDAHKRYLERLAPSSGSTRTSAVPCRAARSRRSSRAATC